VPGDYESLATEGRPWGVCVPAALAIELVHRTSLIFDDIQDHSPQRNHLPTVWTTWGVDQALNGDWHSPASRDWLFTAWKGKVVPGNYTGNYTASLSLR